MRCPGLLLVKHFDGFDCTRTDVDGPGLPTAAGWNVEAQKLLAPNGCPTDEAKERRSAQRTPALHLHAAQGAEVATASYEIEVSPATEQRLASVRGYLTASAYLDVGVRYTLVLKDGRQIDIFLTSSKFTGNLPIRYPFRLFNSSDVLT